MECLDMYNSEHKMSHHHHHQHQHQYHYHNYNHDYHNNNHHLMQASPRISFSNDFVDAQLVQAKRQQELIMTRAETASSDFEFSAATSHSMMSADELFFKGRLLPFKDTNNGNGVVSGKDMMSETASSRVITTTLREELLQGEDDVTFRPAAKGRWKSLLGLKRAHHGGSHSKSKAEKGVLHDQETPVSKTGALVRNNK